MTIGVGTTLVGDGAIHTGAMPVLAGEDLALDGITHGAGTGGDTQDITDGDGTIHTGAMPVLVTDGTDITVQGIMPITVAEEDIPVLPFRGLHFVGGPI